MLGAEIELGRGIFIAKPLHDQIPNFYSISPWEMESQEGIFKSFKLLQTEIWSLCWGEKGPRLTSYKIILVGIEVCKVNTVISNRAVMVRTETIQMTWEGYRIDW